MEKGGEPGSRLDCSLKTFTCSQMLEEDFRTINYNTNMYIFWWPLIRALYVVVFVIGFTSAW